jgi:hypothetical protein
MLSAVGDLRMFVGTVLFNLYENEVEGLGPGPHRRSGAVVATTPLWARARPLQWHNAETKLSLPSSQPDSYLYTTRWHNQINGTYSLITQIDGLKTHINGRYSPVSRVGGIVADHDISPRLRNKLVLELVVRVQLLEFIYGHPAGVRRCQTNPLDEQLLLALSQSSAQNNSRSGTRPAVPDRRKSPWNIRCLAMEFLEQADMEHIV